MLEVARWLAEQGQCHHAEAFAENGIAGDVLRDLRCRFEGAWAQPR